MKLRKVTASKYGKIHYAPEGLNISLCGQYISPNEPSLGKPVSCKACVRKVKSLTTVEVEEPLVKLREGPDLPPAS